MRKTTLLPILISAAFFVAPALHAQEYMFTYSKLFTQLKNNTKEGHEEVKVGIFFVNVDDKTLCSIDKAWMEKEEKYEDLTPKSGKELLLPLDNNLKQANPLVFVHTPKDMRCDFSMVVMTKEALSGRVDYGQIERLLPQMQSMLEDLGGMFASWFTPDVEGVTLEFPTQIKGTVHFSNGKEVALENGRARILLADIGEDGYITLPAETTRVLPWLPSAK